MKPIVVRGGGDIATGTIMKLYKSGYPVLVLECEKPTAIRREAAFCEAVYEGEKCVEGVICYLAKDMQEAEKMILEGKLVMLVDPEAKCLDTLRPDVLIDAILAKRNLGTSLAKAEMVIALGPGFEAGVDADYVIETMRGHRLGRIIADGTAQANTGIPGIIGGYGIERVIHAPASGVFHALTKISDVVAQGQVIGTIISEGVEAAVTATIDGVLRGLIRDGYEVNKGLKMADIDPRLEERENCFTVSDKARCIAGSVLELVVHHEKTGHRP